MLNRNGYLVFSGQDISTVFAQKNAEAKSLIDGESESYILNVAEEEFIQHLVDKLTLDEPVIQFDDVHADSDEREIPAEYFPMSYAVTEGRTYNQQIIKYFIPCSGNVSLLRFRPASIIFVSGNGNFELRGEELLYELINFNLTADEITRKFQAEERKLRATYDHLLSDIRSFNKSLTDQIRNHLKFRKEKLGAKNNLLSQLGVPIKRRTDTPSTFLVPKPLLRKKITVKPSVNEKTSLPEPTLDGNTYSEILKVINDVGKNFERMPSVYKDKDEETLRDHILLTLDPNFEMGSASGETFNHIGRTDILLRYDSSTVFVAECKFWNGEKQLFSTIDQLLGYLTWRDSKAAIIFFVRQKNISAVLETIESGVPKHSNFIKFINKTDENWFNYIFHLNGDEKREIKLAIQLFHIPGNSKQNGS